jgi:hypothetical protein
MSEMTIKLDTDTGKLIGVYDDGKGVKGESLDKPGMLMKVPMNMSNPSILVFSQENSPGCYCYIRDGRRYCVPTG